jgi:DNA-binding response OmpR family regulator
MTDAEILVIAEHPMIGTLLSALVELAGHRARFPEAGEAADAAVARARPPLVLLDFEHPASARDAVYHAARLAGSRVLLFGSALAAEEIDRLASRRGVGWFDLPIGYNAFAARVAGVLARPAGRRISAETRGEASV